MAGLGGGYSQASWQNASGIAEKETVLGVHLVPLLGGKKLDAISNGDIQRVKTRLASKAPKAVNNVLTFLNVVLRKPVEWNVLERMPCVIR